MHFLANQYRTPRSLPEPIRNAHLELTISHIDRLTDPIERSAALDRIQSRDWPKGSMLLNIDGNVWPDRIREWMKRIGICEDEYSWMSERFQDRTDTHESRMRELIQERNSLAHGERPDELKQHGVFVDLFTDCQRFVERSFETVEVSLYRHLRKAPQQIGEAAPRNLRPNSQYSLAFRVLNNDLEVGQHLIATSRGEAKSVRVRSIMSDGRELQHAPSGTERISVTVSKPVSGMQLRPTP